MEIFERKSRGCTKSAAALVFNQLIIWNWSKLIKQKHLFVLRTSCAFKRELECGEETRRNKRKNLGLANELSSRREVERSILNFNLSYEFIIFVGLFMMLVCNFSLMASPRCLAFTFAFTFALTCTLPKRFDRRAHRRQTGRNLRILIFNNLEPSRTLRISKLAAKCS